MRYILTVATFTLNAAIREKILLVQFGQKSEDALAQSDQLHGGTVSGSCRLAFVTGFLGRAHLVHPGAAIGVVPAKNETCVRMNSDLIIEPAIRHMLVDLFSSVSFPEAKTLKVYRESFLDYFVQRLILKPFLQIT